MFVNWIFHPTILRGQIISAGCVYALIVFLIGFVFGTVRVLLVAPRLSETVAVLLETPFILLVSWKVSTWSISRFAVGDDLAARTAMGCVAFAVLMIAEFGVAGFVSGRSLAEQLVVYESIPGIIGLAGQVSFAALPILQGPRS